MLNLRAKSCTALQSNFRLLSLNMNCGGPKNKIISLLKNSITPRELHKSAGIAHATGHFNICSTATIRYWYPALFRGKGPAKSMNQVWNSPLSGIFPANSLRFADFAFWQISQLFTKLAPSFRIFGHQKRFGTNAYVVMRSQCPISSCNPFRMLSRMSM